MGTPETIAVENAHMPPFFAKTPISIARGEGVWVWDEEGRRYLDLTAGWGVTSIGHAHPVIVRALAEQGARIIQNPDSGLTYSPGAGEAARAARRHPARRASPASSSPTAAPRPTTRPSSWRARPPAAPR